MVHHENILTHSMHLSFVFLLLTQFQQVHRPFNFQLVFYWWPYYVDWQHFFDESALTCALLKEKVHFSKVEALVTV